MLPNNKIEYLTRKEIDIEKWNACIENASNGLIYSFSYYLDALCTNWDALVINNYEAVMPLPWRKKWGFYYIYQPYFIAALGVFGNEVPASTIELCLHYIPPKFRYLEIDLNEKNSVNTFPGLKATTRKNIFLELNQPYEILFKNYKRLARRKINYALENGLIIHDEISPEVIVKLYERYYEQEKRIIPHEAYTGLIKALNALPKKNLRAYLVKNENNIIAFYVVLVDDKNVYSLIGGSTKEGKKMGAFYLATDAVIKEFSATGKTFRFEGSDIKGIAFFDMQFGSYPITYLHIKQNKLPWPFYHFK